MVNQTQKSISFLICNTQNILDKFVSRKKTNAVKSNRQSTSKDLPLSMSKDIPAPITQ
jgi:hypothetical protein